MPVPGYRCPTCYGTRGEHWWTLPNTECKGCKQIVTYHQQVPRDPKPGMKYATSAWDSAKGKILGSRPIDSRQRMASEPYPPRQRASIDQRSNDSEPPLPRSDTPAASQLASEDPAPQRSRENRSEQATGESSKEPEQPERPEVEVNFEKWRRVGYGRHQKNPPDIYVHERWLRRDPNWHAEMQDGPSEGKDGPSERKDG